MTSMKNFWKDPVDLIACADNPGILPVKLKKLRKDRTITAVAGLLGCLVAIFSEAPALLSFGLVLVLRCEIMGCWIQQLLLIQHPPKAERGLREEIEALSAAQGAD